MVEQLHFDPMFRVAMQQVFGKTLICRDMDTASHYSRSSNMDCITLEGQSVGVLVCNWTASKASMRKGFRKINFQSC